MDIAMMELEILAGDEETRAICELYWEIDTDLEFVYKVAEVVKVKKSNLPSFVRDNCNALCAKLAM
jgi:hypothetical protein